ALPALEAAVRADARWLYVYHLARCQLALDRPGEAVTSSRRALALAQEQGASESDLQKEHYQLALPLRKTAATPHAHPPLAEAARLAAAPEAPRECTALDPSLAFDLPPAARRELRVRARAGLARAYFNLGVLESRKEDVAPATERFARAAALLARAAVLDPD